MEFEDRNPKPEKNTGTSPTLILIILVSIVCLLLYLGWNLMSDDVKNNELVQDEVVAKEADSIVVDTPSALVNPEKEIVETKNTASEEKEEQPKTVEPVRKDVISKVKEAVNSNETALHTVKSGETFYGIANKFNVSSSTLKILNPDVDPEGIKVGVTKINVPVQTVHTVGPGDILRVVAQKYSITVDQLMAANGKTKNYAERGEKLLIPLKTKK